MSVVSCPLCCGTACYHYHEDARRLYWQCQSCLLVFVDKRFWLSPDAEKAEYDLHENHVDDPGYQNFLNRLAQPLLASIDLPAAGLDFGCGPGPALQIMLERAGCSVDVYDIFYAPDTAVFQRRYDFITATEVVEHLHQPRFELDRLWALLKPGGCLALMTKRVKSQEAFARWHYKNDLTHVCFFSEQTFQWLAGCWQAQVFFPAADVVFFQKS